MNTQHTRTGTPIVADDELGRYMASKAVRAEVTAMLHNTIKPIPDKVVRHVKRANLVSFADILYCIAGAGLVILGFLLATGKI